MLPLSLVQEIRRLLDEGKLSQRKIAAKLGVSRGTISAMATGRRGDFGREKDEQQLPLGPAERCKTCGKLVSMPCVYCRAVEYRERLDEQRRVA